MLLSLLMQVLTGLFFILNDFHKVMQYELGFAKQEQSGSGKQKRPFPVLFWKMLLWKINRNVTTIYVSR